MSKSKILRRNFIDNQSFGFIQGAMMANPDITISDAMALFMSRYRIEKHEFNIRTERKKFDRMSKELKELLKG